MTFEEAKKIFLNRGYIEVSGGTYYDADKWRESITVISKWLEQEPCEDCISRQAAKKALEDRFMELQKRHDDTRYETNYCLNTILELPPVIPKESEDKE